MLILFSFSIDTETGKAAVAGNVTIKEALGHLMNLAITTEATAKATQAKDKLAEIPVKENV